MAESSSKIHDIGLIILRSIFGLSCVCAIIILVLVYRRVNIWKYAEIHAYENVVNVSSISELEQQSIKEDGK